MATSASIRAVVEQHAESSVALWRLRSVLVGAPHVRLRDLERLDGRIAAHLDGLALAGPDGWKLATAALESPGPGEMFTAAALAIAGRHTAALHSLFALAEAQPATVPGLVSAFGWAAAEHLRGIVKNLLSSRSALCRRVGLAACVMHRVEPGAALRSALTDDDPRMRRIALRIAGETCRREYLSACLDSCSDEDDACRYHAARSALLMGERCLATATMRPFALTHGAKQPDALRLLLKLTSSEQSRVVLKALAAQGLLRALVTATGTSGDPCWLPWLIDQMHNEKLARLAGESFSSMTGVDLAYLDLDTRPSDDARTGPSDDPDDADVSMDEDEGLAWPDPAKIDAWWRANQSRFVKGRRYFVGGAVDAARCVEVLESGYQRQRLDAAQYLSLLVPNVPVFQTAAPAWRQKRWIAGELPLTDNPVRNQRALHARQRAGQAF